MLGAAALRIFVSSLDSYVHNWDERFHALVAKNMMNDPLTPMLHADPVIPYDYTAWCCNHIWLHKQPLFLWQMAASLKIFGVNELALRIPSAIMSGVSVYFIYSIVKQALGNIHLALGAAILFALSHYQVELSSGLLSLDQNDAVFFFYVLASFWAFSRYTTNDKILWPVLIGIFSGCAVLCKWAPGLLIYAGWGIALVLDAERRKKSRSWLMLFLSFAIAVAIALPWQIYIYNRFPAEASFESKQNLWHLTEAIGGHDHPWWYYLSLLKTHYSTTVFIPFIVMGLFVYIFNKHNTALRNCLIAMMVGCYIFFSFFVKTKMPAFTFIVAPVIFLLIAIPLYNTFYFLTGKKNSWVVYAGFLLAGYFLLKPAQIINERKSTNIERNAKVHNTEVYKSFPDSLCNPKTIVINCKTYENIEIMFYKNVNAYHWYPEKNIVDSLLQRGYNIYAYKSHNDQLLPDYIINDKRIKIIDKELK